MELNSLVPIQHLHACGEMVNRHATPEPANRMSDLFRDEIEFALSLVEVFAYLHTDGPEHKEQVISHIEPMPNTTD